MANLDGQPYLPSHSAIEDLAHSERIVSIGPLTNLAEALEHPGHRVREIAMMGALSTVEQNTTSARTSTRPMQVFRSGVGITAVRVDQTERVGFSARDFAGLRGELGLVLEAEVRQFWKFTEQDRNTPHDPIAIIMLTSPQLFSFRRGHISVETTGTDEGITRFRSDRRGPHRIVSDLDVDAIEEEIRERLYAACEWQHRRISDSSQPGFSVGSWPARGGPARAYGTAETDPSVEIVGASKKPRRDIQTWRLSGAHSVRRRVERTTLCPEVRSSHMRRAYR